MITLNLEYREVLWWMQGGMAGSEAGGQGRQGCHQRSQRIY